MEKNYLQDVIPPAQKKSIREIPLPVKNKKKVVKKPIISQTISPHVDKVVESGDTDNWNEAPSSNRYGKPNRAWFYLFSGVAMLLLLILFFIFSSLDSAVVYITPKNETKMVDVSLAIHPLLENGGEKDSLGYRVIKLEKEVEIEVVAKEEERIQQKASGVITIHNEYSPSLQTLIAKTRFRASNGLIYRIGSSVSVPGYKMVDGKKIPGTVDIEVVADKVGDKYNIASSDFTIPSFEGQDPYETFYAKTKTSISGGFDGVKKIISEEQILASSKELNVKLTSSLIEELNNQVTDEFVSVYSPESFSLGAVEQGEVSGDNVLLKTRGTIIAKLFTKIDLSNYIASKTIDSYEEGQNVLIVNFDEIVLSIVEEDNTTVSEEEEEEVNTEKTVPSENIKVLGESTFVWQNNKNDLSQELVNVSKMELGNILHKFPDVKDANAVVKPLWRAKFPSNLEDIKIVITDLE